jgi:hypothetical protein
MSYNLIKNLEGKVCKCGKGVYHYFSSRNMWRCVTLEEFKSVKPRCDRYVSLYEDSIFSNLRHNKVSPVHVLLVARHLLEGYSTSQSATEVKCSPDFVNSWRKKIKRVLAAKRLEEVEGKYYLISIVIDNII